MADRCVPVVWQVARRRRDEKGREEEEGCTSGTREKERERDGKNGRMVVEALSTGSLGHSYASAVGTITAKPCLLHKISNTNTDTRQSGNQLTTRRIRVSM